MDRRPYCTFIKKNGLSCNHHIRILTQQDAGKQIIYCWSHRDKEPPAASLASPVRPIAPWQGWQQSAPLEELPPPLEELPQINPASTSSALPEPLTGLSPEQESHVRAQVPQLRKIYQSRFSSDLLGMTTLVREMTSNSLVETLLTVMGYSSVYMNLVESELTRIEKDINNINNQRSSFYKKNKSHDLTDDTYATKHAFHYENFQKRIHEKLKDVTVMIKVHPAFLVWKSLSLLFSSSTELRPSVLQTIKSVMNDTHARLETSMNTLYEQRTLSHTNLTRMRDLDKFYHEIPPKTGWGYPGDIKKHPSHDDWVSAVNRFLNNPHKNLKIDHDQWSFVKNEVKNEVKEEVKNALKEEVKNEVKDKEVKKEVKKEQNNIGKFY